MKKVLVRQNCLICKQSSLQTICQFCIDDLTPFDNKIDNLIDWPPVANGLADVHFKHLLAFSDYQWPISRLLTGLKFSRKTHHAHALSKLFYQNRLIHLNPIPELIIPVPLHSNRYLVRKFNQSIELAKHIGKLSSIPIVTNWITRTQSTAQQSLLSAAKRKHNMRRAFSLTNTANSSIQATKHIAIFDDVVTTGATVDAIYQLLKQANPNLRIDIWSICITLKH